MQCRGLIAGGVDAHPDRDLPGHAADQGGGQRRQDRRAEARARTCRSSSRSRSRPPARCWSAPTSPPPPTVVHALDVPLIGPELRHRPAGDGRARPLPRAELARADLACQPNAGLPELVDGQTHYPLGAAETGRLDGALRRARTASTSSAAAAAPAIAAYPGAGRDAAPARAGDVAGPRRSRASRIWMPSVASPLSAGAAAPGERLFLHRRALQRQRLEEVARAARRRDDWDGCVAIGPRAGRRGLQQPRRLHRLRRPRRDGRDERGRHAASPPR